MSEALAQESAGAGTGPGRPSARGSTRLARHATLILTLYALLLGLGLGLGSAYWATMRGDRLGAVRAGAWTTYPRIGSARIDPYARALVARTGDLPLGIGEGLAFETGRDDEGRPLSALCRYRIGRTTPQARLWTLTVYGDGRVAEDPLRRAGFTSSELLRAQDGGFDIVLARDPEPGNWLPAPVSGGIRLVMRLYDTPAASVSGAIDARAMPGIERTGCAP